VKEIMKPVLVHLIAAARPNFMKVAPLYHVLRKYPWFKPVVVHTGQHYDANMSDMLLNDLGLPDPDLHLGVGSGTHAEQTAGVMLAYERVCLEQPPNWVVVVGDVNSTIACALVAKKLYIPVAHLEAGLRSWDRTMPEEINRIVTDAISDLLWTPSADADENLRREGIPKERIVLVGNIMIDSYEMLREKIEGEQMARRMQLENALYGVITLHRPSNVDHKERLAMLVSLLIEIGQIVPLVFPVHPRTRARLEAFGLWPHPVHESGDPGQTCYYRFRGDSGGNHLSKYSLLDAKREHRATDYDPTGDEPACALRDASGWYQGDFSRQMAAGGTAGTLGRSHCGTCGEESRICMQRAKWALTYLGFLATRGLRNMEKFG
jgi:hypothetical protein